MLLLHTSTSAIPGKLTITIVSSVYCKVGPCSFSSRVGKWSSFTRLKRKAMWCLSFGWRTRRRNMIVHVVSGANMKYYISLGTRNQFKYKKNFFFHKCVPVDLLAWKLTIPVLYLYSVIYCSEVRHHLDFLCPAVVSWCCHFFSVDSDIGW